jgi:hypothetical protein
MKVDFLALNQSLASDPELVAHITASALAVFADSECTIIDQSFGNVVNSYADFIDQMSLLSGVIPFTAQPWSVVPSGTFAIPAGVAAIGPNDLFIPIRFTSSAEFTLDRVPLAGFSFTGTFINNTSFGDYQIEMYFVDFFGNVMPQLNRTVIVTPTSIANGKWQWTIWNATRAIASTLSATQGVMDLTTPQSNGYLKIFDIGVLQNVLPASVTNIFNYTGTGAFPTCLQNPYSVIIVLRAIGAVNPVITTTAMFASPDKSKALINAIIAKL